jgi:pimeloyl-ACP methyl ester carboxylesterase
MAPSLVTVDGSRLEYAWVGPPPAAAPTLVFLHEGLGCARQWRGVPASLAAQTGCGALVYSRRGYGDSDGYDEPRPVDFMHREALAILPRILAAFAVTRPVLVGHSDGASIAVIYTGAGAGPVGPLVLAAPHVFVETCTVEEIARTRELFETTDLRGRLARHHGANTDSMVRRWTDAWLAPAFRDWNIESSLAGIDMPLLVIQGRDDPYGTERQVAAVAGRVRGPCDTLMLASCGHAPQRDRRETFEAAVAAFVVRYVTGASGP